MTREPSPSTRDEQADCGECLPDVGCQRSGVRGSYAAGKEKSAACAACHGPDGNKPITPDIPRLGGQHYDYLEHSLKAYRSGARENAMMSPMAKPLTDKDIKDVAWYFSRQPGLVTKY